MVRDARAEEASMEKPFTVVSTARIRFLVKTKLFWKTQSINISPHNARVLFSHFLDTIIRFPVRWKQESVKRDRFTG